MSTIPVSSIKDADCFTIFGRQAVKELYEAAFVVDLWYVLAEFLHGYAIRDIPSAPVSKSLRCCYFSSCCRRRSDAKPRVTISRYGYVNLA